MSRDMDAERVLALASAAGLDLTREEAEVLAPIAGDWFSASKELQAVIGGEQFWLVPPITQFHHAEETSGR